MWPKNGTIELPQEVEEQARSVLCGEAKTVDIVTDATSPKKEVIGQLSGRIYMVILLSFIEVFEHFLSSKAGLCPSMTEKLLRNTLLNNPINHS